MLTGTIPLLCISGNSQGRQVKGLTFLDKKVQICWRRMKLLFETMTSCQTLPFSRQTIKKKLSRCIYGQMHTTISSLVNPRLSQDVQNKRKRQSFLFHYGPTAPSLYRKNSSFLLLSLTRARTEVVYIAHGKERGRGRRKVNRNPNSKVRWWKKGFRQRQFLHSNKKLHCFDSFPISYIPTEMLEHCSPHAPTAAH